ncbi:MAG: DoxX family membrane protein [Candidatus Omnitrophota bacterium]|jgi:uncharacterized membrane protein YphA (DoxX/SURF4 family)|nr:MAG: DoxX family membrane protein [Candidatus Omnitrophota bacterium]
MLFRHPYFTLLLRVFLGLIFVYSGYSKLIDLAEMANDIDNYRILPTASVNVIAIILPPVELITGFCLIFGLFLDGALMITTSMLVVFCIAIESAVLRGLDIECGCALTSDAEIVGMKVLLRDVFFLCCSLLIWPAHRHILRLDAIMPWGRESVRAKTDTSASGADV